MTVQRAVLYTRISEKDESFDKVELQEKRLRALALAEGYDVTHVYTDDGISAYSGALRPEFVRLVSDLRAGKFDVVLAVAQDRMARNKVENEAFLAECASKGVTWHTLSEGKTDPTNASSAAMASVRGVFAQLESDVRKVRLLARFEEEVSEGRPLWGVRPFGYNADRLTLHQTEADELRWAYKTFLEGGSIYTILKSWNERGILTTRGKKWAWASVQQLLKRPRNAGVVMRHDKEVAGVTAQWEPVVSREDWQTVCDIMSDPKRKTAPGRKAVHLMSSVAVCGVCSQVMRSGVGNGAPIYKCTAKLNAQAVGERHPSIATAQVDPLVRKALVDAYLSAPTDELPGDTVDLAPLDNELSKVRSARAKLVKLVASELIEEADAIKELTELKNREADLEEQRTELARQSVKLTMLADLRDVETHRVEWDDVAAAREAVADRFDALDLDKKRELVRTFLSVTIQPGRSAKRVQITHKLVTALNDEAA